MDFTKRTVQEVWHHHDVALAARNIDDFILDFSDDCLFINNPKGGHACGIFRGPQGVAKWCKEFFALFGEITDFSTDGPFIEENVVLIEWAIESKTHSVKGGVDTFVIENGQFSIVTVVYDVTPKG